MNYDKLYPSGSEMHKFFSSDTFPKLRPIVSSIDILKFDLAHFL